MYSRSITKHASNVLIFKTHTTEPVHGIYHPSIQVIIQTLNRSLQRALKDSQKHACYAIVKFASEFLDRYGSYY